ncbi:MAG: hypothetical protein HY912_16175 [Desulfomonile tiedjei]|uniref:Uncharacterized protein n=1 Tax=Desulfomonile tiedjei TaxID=2358 RepID=A0A9D6V3V5_9BACT|nr:hypothetical protein [Desulfomonile tiedjei]
MRRLLAALILVLMVTASVHGSQSCPSTGCETGPPPPDIQQPAKVPTPIYRVCFRGLKPLGHTRKNADCRICQLKASSSKSETDCHDFYSVDAALRFWNEHCCD